MAKIKLNELIDKMLYLPAKDIEELIKDEKIEMAFYDKLDDLSRTEDPKELKIFNDIYNTDFFLLAQSIAENTNTPSYILEHYSDLENMDFKGKHQVQREAINNLNDRGECFEITR